MPKLAIHGLTPSDRAALSPSVPLSLRHPPSDLRPFKSQKLATHGLTPSGRAATVRPGFLSLQGEAQRLTPLATEYRYPGDAHAPEPETAQTLLRAAEEIHRVVIASLASEGPKPTAKE